MRIARLDLLRYGCFTDRPLSFPAGPCDLHFVVGRNEAGKSTARAALSDLLFGIDVRSPYVFLHGGGGLRVGAALEHEGKLHVFRRRKGKGLTLLDEADRPVAEGALASLLAGADRASFERTFSLDHPALVDGGKQILEAKDDLGRLLFQASAGLRGLGDLDAELEQEADGLWGPRKRAGRAYDDARARFEAAGDQLKAVTVRAQDWQEALRASQDASSRLGDADGERAQAAATCARLERIGRVAPGLTRRRALLVERAALAGAPLLPQDAEKRAREAGEAIALAAEQLREKTAEFEEARGERDAVTVDRALLAREADVKRVVAQHRQVERFPSDLEKRRAEVGVLAEQVDRLVARLGWPKAPREVLRARIPSEIALARVHDLAVSKGRIDAEVAQAADALAERRRELTERLAARDLLGDERVPSPVRDALAVARKLGDADLRRGELVRAVEPMRKKLERALEQLAPWSGPLQVLHAQVFPGEEELSGLDARFARLDEERRSALQRRAEAAAALEQKRLFERELLREAHPVAREELDESRGLRDRLWARIRPLLTGEGGAPVDDPRSVARDFEDAVRAADALADRRYGAAEASASLQAARAEIERRQASIAESERGLKQIESAGADLASELARFGAPLGGAPKTPAALRTWLARRGQAIDLDAQLERAEAALEEHDGAVAVAGAAIRTALAGGGLADADLEGRPLHALVATAEERVRCVDAARAKREALVDAIATLERRLPGDEKRCGKARSEAEAWRRDWAAALRAIDLPEDVSLESAERALGLIREVARKLDDIENVERTRIGTMERDLAEFRRDVARLVGLVAPDLAVREAAEAVETLAGRLENARTARAEHELALRRIDRLDEQRREVVGRKISAEATLQPLLDGAGTSTVAGLQQAIARSDRLRSVGREIDDSERHILDAGDGLGIAELEAQVSADDEGSREARREAARIRAERLHEECKELAVKAHDARRALDAIAGSADAAEAAAQRVEALATMSDAIDRHLRVRTALQLLRWAIERFRREKQGPLLTRASELFAMLTLGEFRCLAVDSDDRDQPQLVGLRKDGRTRVPVAAMSTGTTDQLYMALRLAAVELRLDAAAPLPFVADDLFVQYDDERAAAGIRVLAGLAARTQVIFFTHHEHLVEVSRRTLASDSFAVLRL